MGTSSARRGPTTRLWRLAKGAATRYLSPAAGAGVSAREVVARYLTALEETPGRGDRLAAFRFTRKMAQELGAFWEEVRTRGWETALQARGLASWAKEPPERLAPALGAVLVQSSGGLEEAVARTALALVLPPAVKSRRQPDPGQVVRQFLGLAVFLRLALDLGEPLEAAAGGYERLRDGLRRIQALIEAGLAAASPPGEPPGAPGPWQGLAGWTWVTAVMAGLLTKLK